MKTLLPVLAIAALFLTSCTKTSHEGDAARQGITVCGTLADDTHQPIANAFIELHHSAKDPTVMQSRYQVGRTDTKGQFEVQGITQGQYWLSVVPKGACNPKSKDENEARRVQVDVTNGTPGPECKTQWQVMQDASCKVTIQ